jgi:hypothetical protein
MEQKSVDERLGIKRHDPLAIMMPVILPVEGHPSVSQKPAELSDAALQSRQNCQ